MQQNAALKDKKLTIKIDPDIADIVRQLAQSDRRSAASLINLLVRDFLRPQSK